MDFDGVIVPTMISAWLKEDVYPASDGLSYAAAENYLAILKGHYMMHKDVKLFDLQVMTDLRRCGSAKDMEETKHDLFLDGRKIGLFPFQGKEHMSLIAFEWRNSVIYHLDTSGYTQADHIVEVLDKLGDLMAIIKSKQRGTS